WTMPPEPSIPAGRCPDGGSAANRRRVAIGHVYVLHVAVEPVGGVFCRFLSFRRASAVFEKISGWSYASRCSRPRLCAESRSKIRPSTTKEHHEGSGLYSAEDRPPEQRRGVRQTVNRSLSAGAGMYLEIRIEKLRRGLGF